MSLALDVAIRPTDAVQGARTVKRSIEDIGRSAKTMESVVGGTVRRLKGLLVGLGAAFSLRQVLQNTIRQEQAYARLEAAIKSTGGAAGKTADDLSKMAAEMQVVTTYGDEAVMEMQALLLTFKEIKGDVFDEATRSVLDLSAAMGQSLQGSAIMLGKALNDPVLGLTAMRRVGIQFSDAQEEVIKKLVETGDKAGAQRMILQELQSQFGGMAKTLRGTLGGALESAKNAFGDLLEMNKVSNADRLRSAIEGLTRSLQSDAARKFADEVGYALAEGASLAAKAIETLGDNADKLMSTLKGFAAIKISSSLLSLLGVSGPVGGAVALGAGALVAISDHATKTKESIEQLRDRMEELRGEIGRLESRPKLMAFFDQESLRVARQELDATERQIHALENEYNAILNAAEGNVAKKTVTTVTPKQETGTGGKKSGPSAAESLVSSMRDKMQYLNADGEQFLGTLDGWIAKSNTLSADWKRLVDLKQEIMGQKARTVADETAAALARQTEQTRLLAEAQEAASAGVERFWSDMRWEHGQGLLDDTSYFEMLQANVDALTEGTDEWKRRFEELQSVASSMAALNMTNLNDQLRDGAISTKEHAEAVERLRQEYADLPLVINQVDSGVAAAKNTSDQFGLSAKLWANDLARGLADAIVNARDLGDVLSSIARQIASSALQKLIGGIFGGLFAEGAAFSGGQVMAFAGGGVVDRPTIFPMARGIGLMGEAGPEAIIPLKRGSDGRLGVGSEGGGTTINNFHISAVDAKSFADLVRRNPQAIVAAVGGNYQSNGAMRRVIKGS